MIRFILIYCIFCTLIGCCGNDTYTPSNPQESEATQPGEEKEDSDKEGNTPPEPDIKELFAADMVAVEGGTFTMGQSVVAEASISPLAASNSTDDDRPRTDELPAHSVTVSDFYISRYEVTQRQWTAVMGSNPSYFQEDENAPVESVSWNDVQQFISTLNSLTNGSYRLPTEAEWEYAARGGKHSLSYRYSGSNDIDEVAWYADSEVERMMAVGEKKPNELGLYDMSGNAFEWCYDWYGAYSDSAQTNPKGPSSGEYHVLRGGSWKHSSSGCRVSFRTRIPTYHLNKCGFRLAKGIDLETLPFSDATQESETPSTSTFSHESITSSTITLPYRRLIKESEGESRILVLYLHGGSRKGDDNEAQLEEDGVTEICSYLEERNYSFVMVVPQCPSSKSWGKSLNSTLQQLIEYNIEQYDIDSVYAFGGSMGGTGLWSLISTYPNLITAAMPVAGNPSNIDPESVISTAVYTVMGGNDNLMNVETTSYFVEQVKSLGGIICMDIEPEWGHAQTCTDSYTDSRLDWIFAR